MSEANATTSATAGAPAAATIPAAPAATATEASAAAASTTPDAGAAQAAPQGNRQRARDLAGKFMGDRRAEAAALAAKAAETPTAPAAAPTEKVALAALSSEGAPAAPVAPPKDAAASDLLADKPAEPADAAEQRRKAAEAEAKSWKEIRRRKKQQRDNHAALLADRAAVAAEKERFAKLESERVADEQLKSEQPDKWLEKHKFDFRDVALREVQKQQLTPEQKAADDRFAKLEADLAAEREARKSLEQEATTRKDSEAKEREAKQREDALVTLATEVRTEWASAKPEFPTLAEHYTVDEIVEAANRLRLDHFEKTSTRDASGRIVKSGVEAPLEDVFAFMEKNAVDAQKRFSRQETAERVERATTATTVVSTRAKVGPPVTNQVSATRASPPKPQSDEQKRAAAVALAGSVMGPRH